MAGCASKGVEKHCSKSFSEMTREKKQFTLAATYCCPHCLFSFRSCYWCGRRRSGGPTAPPPPPSDASPDPQRASHDPRGRQTRVERLLCQTLDFDARVRVSALSVGRATRLSCLLSPGSARLGAPLHAASRPPVCSRSSLAISRYPQQQPLPRPTPSNAERPAAVGKTGGQTGGERRGKCLEAMG